MKVNAILEYEKEAPKSHAFGIKTDDGILIKVWLPKALVKKHPDELTVILNIPSGGTKRPIETNTDDGDEDDEDDETDDSDEDEDDHETSAPKKKKSAKKRR